MDYEITITPNGISVKTCAVRRVRDEETGEVLELPTLPHYSAVGIADFKTPEEYQAKVAEMLAPHLGKDFSALKLAPLSPLMDDHA